MSVYIRSVNYVQVVGQGQIAGLGGREARALATLCRRRHLHTIVAGTHGTRSTKAIRIMIR